MHGRRPRARIRHRLRGLVLALILLPLAGAAHHSGIYDEADVTQIAGSIISISWRNPHVRLTLEARDPAGGRQNWQLEGTSVNALERWGIEPNRFRVGDRLLATGPRSKFDATALLAATVELSDGTRLVLWPNVADRLGLAETGVTGLFPPPIRRSEESPVGIFRVWTPRGRPRAASDGLPLTTSALVAARAYDPIRDDPALRCIPPGMPVMLDTPYPVEFVDRGDRIIMRFEEWDGVRTIYMDPRDRPPVQDPSPKGVSFGRWEGDTLAIFTLYIDYPYSDDLGTPQSESVTVLERYTLSADESRLDWTVTVTDPETFTVPVVRRGFMSWEPGEQIKPFNCTLPEAPG